MARRLDWKLNTLEWAESELGELEDLYRQMSILGRNRSYETRANEVGQVRQRLGEYIKDLQQD